MKALAKKFLETVEGSRGKVSVTRVTMMIMSTLYVFMAVWKLVKSGEIVDIPLQLAGFLAVLYGTNTIPSQIGKAIEAYMAQREAKKNQQTTE